MALLSQIEADPTALTPAQTRRLEYLLYYERFDRAHSLQRAIARLNEAREIYQLNAATPIARLAREAAEVDAQRRNALGIVDEDDRSAVEQAYEYDGLLRRLTLADERMHSNEPVIKALQHALSDDGGAWSPLADKLEKLKGIKQELQQNEHADVSGLVVSYEETSVALDKDLTAMARSFRRDTKATKIGRRRKVIAISIEEVAAQYFGLSTSALPTEDTIASAFSQRLAEIYSSEQAPNDPTSRSMIRDAVAWRQVLMETKEWH